MSETKTCVICNAPTIYGLAGISNKVESVCANGGCVDAWLLREQRAAEAIIGHDVADAAGVVGLTVPPEQRPAEATSVDPMGRNPCAGHGPGWSCTHCRNDAQRWEGDVGQPFSECSHPSGHGFVLTDDPDWQRCERCGLRRQVSKTPQRSLEASRGPTIAGSWTNLENARKSVDDWLSAWPGLNLAGPARDSLVSMIVRRDVEREQRRPDAQAAPIMPASGRLAVQFLLTRIGSWTHARWDQHLRNEIGDAAANVAIRWIEEAFDVKGYGELRACEAEALRRAAAKSGGDRG